jgi:predicted metal-dependent hydrolase
MDSLETTPKARAIFVKGVAHFNAHEFWEAHEAWEELWLGAEGDAVQFYQGLIQLAAAYHHMKRGTLSGAVRLVDAALGRLAPFASTHNGIDRSEAVTAARAHQQWAREHERVALSPTEFPKLTMLEDR